MTKQKKLVYGIGLNDSSFPVQAKKSGNCPFYRKWVGMLMRCYDPVFLKKNPKYTGCTVIQEWHSFTVFREWMKNQDWKGKELDKDLIGDGRIYSPETCVFVSKEINIFIRDFTGTRNRKYPIGVLMCSKGKLQSRIRIDGKLKHLGYFKTEEEAHQAWINAKADLALKLANKQSNKKIAKALREYSVKIQKTGTE